MKLRYNFAGLLLVTVLSTVTYLSLLYDSNTKFKVVSVYNKVVSVRNKAVSAYGHLSGTSDHAISNNKCDMDYAASVSTTSVSSYSRYLSAADINDSKTIANNAYSVQSLAVNQTVYSLGENIRVRIELYDGYGKHLTSGGDILRIWLISPSKKASVNGYVTDHENGSYTGHVMGLWTGNCIIKTSIANTKEHISIVQNHIEKYGQGYAMLAGFGENTVVEKTTCSVRPDVYGLRDVCNLTTENYGHHWYCGRPTHPNLTCTDWTTMHDYKTHAISLNKSSIVRPYKHMLLKNSPIVNITGGHDIVRPSDLPCHQRPSIDTWIEKSPVGFFYHNKWYLRACKTNFIPSRESYEKCLRGHYVLLVGDSNIRSWFWEIEKIIKSVSIKNNKLTGKLTLKQTERPDLNLTMLWGCHEMPFYSGERVLPRKSIQSVAWHIDKIPRLKKVIVVMHYTYHFVRITPSEFRAHVRNAKQAIMRLFERNPEAKVFIKGPHSINYSGNFDPVDYIRKIHEQILYEEMLGLHNKIVYLNEWDLTTCIENVNVHPSDKTVKDMINHFMGYLCGN